MFASKDTRTRFANLYWAMGVFFFLTLPRYSSLVHRSPSPPPQWWKRRLSCYYTHLMTIYSVIMLTFHLTTRLQSSVSGQNNLLPLLYPYYLFAMKNSTVIALRLSDLISVLFTILLSYFTYHKKMGHTHIVTPLQNQPVTAWRVWTNVYIHYFPSAALRLLRVPGVESYLKYTYNRRAIVGSTGLVLAWFAVYYEVS